MVPSKISWLAIFRLLTVKVWYANGGTESQGQNSHGNERN
jgi:hypothetical protein